MGCSNESDEFQGIRDVLRVLGVDWRTEDRLAKLHTLAEQSVFAVRQMVGAFALADTPNALPQETMDIWASLLLRTALETVCFPDSLPIEANTWEAQAAMWDEYFDHNHKFHLSGIQSFSEDDAWSIRKAVRAAWNIEFAAIGDPVEIGPAVADSAHRVTLLCVRELWIEYSSYLNQAVDNPNNRPALWDAFALRWRVDKTHRQSDRARAKLASELSQMRERLGFAPQSPPPVVNIGNWPDGGKAFAEAFKDSEADQRSGHAENEGVGDDRHSSPHNEGKQRSDHVDRTGNPTHAEDFTSVCWFGERYTFSKGQQAETVRVLWEAWEAGGHGLSQEAIGNRVGSANDRFRLSHVFRKRRENRHHPAWGAMIQETTKGVFALVKP